MVHGLDHIKWWLEEMLFWHGWHHEWIIGDNVDCIIIGYLLIEYDSVTGKVLCKILM